MAMAAQQQQQQRKGSKRTLYPWINSQIVAVAKRGDVEQLVGFIETHAPNMNLVNVSTALHRLATMRKAGSRDSSKLRPMLRNLSGHLGTVLRRSEESGGPAPCQSLANITWSHAIFGFVDIPTLATLAENAVKHLPSFKPYELSTILWAYAQLGCLDPAAWTCSRELFRQGAAAIVDAIMADPQAFTFRCLISACQALAMAGHLDQAPFRAAMPKISSEVRKACCRELTTTMWAFCTAGVTDEWFLTKLAKRATPQLQDLSSGDLKDALRGLAHASFLPRPFLERAALVARAKDQEALRLARSLLATVQLEEKSVMAPLQLDGDASSAITTREPSVDGDHSDDEVLGEEPYNQEAALTDLLGHPFRVDVKNTFLDVEVNEGESGPRHPLRAPEPIFSADVSREELEELRSEYRRLREGLGVVPKALAHLVV